MTEPSLALQKAMVERLRAASAVTDLVPAARISVRPPLVDDFPCVHLGTGQTVDPGMALARDLFDVYADLHVFDRGPDFTSVKRIAGAIREALAERFVAAVDEWHLFDVHVEAMRFMHDPDGKTIHGAITIAAKAKAVA